MLFYYRPLRDLPESQKELLELVEQEELDKIRADSAAILAWLL